MSLPSTQSSAPRQVAMVPRQVAMVMQPSALMSEALIYHADHLHAKQCGMATSRAPCGNRPIAEHNVHFSGDPVQSPEKEASEG